MMLGTCFFSTKLPVGNFPKWWLFSKGIPPQKKDLLSGLGIVVGWPDKCDMQSLCIFMIGKTSKSFVEDDFVEIMFYSANVAYGR